PYGRFMRVDVVGTGLGPLLLKDGTSVVRGGEFGPSGGWDSIPFVPFKPGIHRFTVEYLGNQNYLPSTSGTAIVTVAPNGSTRADLNGDGRADVVWRNRNTGEVGYWLLNGAAIIGSGSLGSVPLSA